MPRRNSVRTSRNMRRSSAPNGKQVVELLERPDPIAKLPAPVAPFAIGHVRKVVLAPADRGEARPWIGRGLRWEAGSALAAARPRAANRLRLPTSGHLRVAAQSGSRLHASPRCVLAPLEITRREAGRRKAEIGALTRDHDARGRSAACGAGLSAPYSQRGNNAPCLVPASDRRMPYSEGCGRDSRAQGFRFR